MMRALRWVSLALATSLLGAGAAPAACPELLSRWGYGPSRAVATTPTHVLYGSGTVLVVLDPSPGGGAVVAELELPGVIEDIAVAGGRAYVAASDAGLRIVDVSTPSAPVELGGLDTEVALGVAVSGNLAYVADSFAGVRIVDVANPAAPAQIARYNPPGYDGALKVAVAGTVAYLAVGNAGLVVLDVANPYVPAPLATYDTPGIVWSVALSGGRAFVATGGEGLRIIDVSKPAVPQELGSIDPGGQAYDVAVAGTRAYVANGGGGLLAVDVSNPASPVALGSTFAGRNVHRVALAGSTAFVATEAEGVLAADIGGAGAPLPLPAPDGPAYATSESVALTGSLAVVAQGDAGVRVFDLTNPAAPLLRGAVGGFGYADSVLIAGARAVALSYSKLAMIDISDPDAPQVAGTTAIPGEAWQGAAMGDHVLVAAGPAGLVVVDVSDPAHPQVVATLDTPGTAEGVAVIGNLAVIADTNGGVRVVDVTNPTAPVEVGALPGLDQARGVAVAGSHVVVAAGGDGLRVLDISAPASPVEVGALDLPASGIFAVAVSGGHAFVDSGELRVISLADPAHPGVVGVFSLPEGVLELAAAGPRVVTVQGAAGLSVFDAGGCSLAPVPELAVYDGSTLLIDGQTAPIVLGTTVAGAGGPPRVTLDVFNEGSAALAVTSVVAPVGFTVESALPVVLGPLEGTTITLALDTTRTGSHSGTVTIASDDADESPFTFVVSGTVTPAPPRRFDFGTAGSPVEPGYQRVTHATGYTPAKGYGWRGGAIASRDRGAGTALARDFNFTPEGTFAVDLPVGWWDVSITAGDPAHAHDAMGIFIEGTLMATWTTAAAQFRSGTFLAHVGDGQLTVALQDLGGGDTAVVVNSLGATPLLPLRFDLGTASSPVASGHTRVTHLSAYSPATGFGWTAGTIGSRDRGSGGDAGRDFNYTPAGTFVVDVPNGTYDVAVTLGDASFAHDQVGVYLEGALVDTVTTAAGTWHSATYAAAVADGQLTAAFGDLGGAYPNAAVCSVEVLPRARRFDFGTASSPLEPGYQRVAHTSAYGAAAGFGWVAGTVGSRDRGIGSARDRDLNYTGAATFAVDLANGDYSVTAWLGDTRYEHDMAAVDAEGVRLGAVTNPAGQLVPLTRVFLLRDGQLTLLLQDLGGSDPYAAITALEVEPLY